MRILLVGINYAPDLIGVAKYNTELCESLVAEGHEVRVVTAPPYYPAWSIPAGLSGSYFRRSMMGAWASCERRSTFPSSRLVQSV